MRIFDLCDLCRNASKHVVLASVLFGIAALAADTNLREVFDAARRADGSAIRRYVTAGTPLTAKDPTEQDSAAEYPEATLLMYAAFHGDRELVEWLISRGADVNAVSRYGETALRLAIKSSAKDVVNHLLGQRASLDAGRGALIPAVESDDIELVRELIRRGADVNRPARISSSSQPVTPLSQAAALASPSMVEFLVGNGAHINHAPHLNGRTGATPLLAAVGENRVKVAELLLQKGAKLEDRGYNFMAGEGVTALYTAVSERNVEMIAMLMRHRPSAATVKEAIERAKKNWNGVQPKDPLILEILAGKTVTP